MEGGHEIKKTVKEICIFPQPPHSTISWTFISAWLNKSLFSVFQDCMCILMSCKYCHPWYYSDIFRVSCSFSIKDGGRYAVIQNLCVKGSLGGQKGSYLQWWVWDFNTRAPGVKNPYSFVPPWPLLPSPLQTWRGGAGRVHASSTMLVHHALCCPFTWCFPPLREAKNQISLI